MSPRTGYETAHSRIRRTRGRAAECVCIACGEQAKDWAYNHNEPDPRAVTDHKGRVYSDDPSFYVPMCRPCHRALDVLPNKPNCPKGHPYEGENLNVTKEGHRTCRACHSERQREARKTPEYQARERERSLRRKAERAKKPPRPELTHCPKGHPYAGDNLTMSGKTKRCRECNRTSKRLTYRSRRDAA